MTIKITKKDNVLQVASPYNQDFIDQANQLGGKWNRSQKVWEFDPRDEDRVREALREIYGTDGTPVPTVDIQISLDELGRLGNELAIGGRVVLHKWNRDTMPKVGDECAVTSGELKSFGGSRKHPRITYKEGTTVEVRSVPKPLAERLISENPDTYSIINNETNGDELTPEEKSLLTALKALDGERRQLLLSKLEQ